MKFIHVRFLRKLEGRRRKLSDPKQASSEDILTTYMEVTDDYFIFNYCLLVGMRKTCLTKNMFLFRDREWLSLGEKMIYSLLESKLSIVYSGKNYL